MWLPQQGGQTDDIDKAALLQQLGGAKQGAPAMGADLGARGGGAPTANTMPVREAPMAAPVSDGADREPDADADDAPPMAAQPAPVPVAQPDMGAGIGALAGMLQPRAPTPQNIHAALGPQAIGNAVQGVGNALKPQNVLNQLKPKTVLQNLRNPLVALGGLFGRRR